MEKSTIVESGDWNLSGERYKESLIANTDYEMVVLGKVLKTTSGGTPLKSKTEYYNNGTIPWLRSGEVSQGLIYHSELFITEKGLKESSAKLFPVDTVLVAMYGATAGQVGLLKFEASTNQAVCGILPDENFNPYYLYLILKSMKDEMIRLSGGGAQPNISQTIIKKFKIPLPPLSVQEEIVEEVDGYQKIIDGARQVVDNYKPTIKIGPDWKMVKLGEVSEVISGQSPKGEYYNSNGEGLAFYQGKTEFTELKIGEPKKWTTQVTKEAYKNDILMSVRAPVGPVNFAIQHCCIGRGLAAIRVGEKVENVFVFNYLKSIQDKIKGSGGAVFDSINRQQISDLQIPLPPLSVQQEIVAQIEAEQEMVNANKKLIEIYEQKIKDKIGEVWGEE